jgi:hypothetical protein
VVEWRGEVGKFAHGSVEFGKIEIEQVAVEP